jgi:glucosylceramidase
MSGYFRFARPGARRVDAQSNVQEIRVTAWQNKNGTIAIPVVNSAHYTYQLDIKLPGTHLNHAVGYLSDNSHNVSATNQYTIRNGRLQAQIEPRAMKTFFLSQ